jgi:3-phosphoshikimate 1-carboxyvinyltransferase
VEEARRPLRAAPVATHGDHRLAMAFAVAGLRLPGVVLDDVRCVAKSYPTFWDDLRTLGGQNWKPSPADQPS